MKKKIKLLYANKYVKIAISAVVVVALLGWVWCSCGSSVAVIDFNAVQMKAKVYQSVLAEQKNMKIRFGYVWLRILVI